MTINGRPVTINFSRRPPRIVSHRSYLGLPVAWPGTIVAISGGRWRVQFECHSVMYNANGVELGRMYLHRSFELRVYYKLDAYVVGAPVYLEKLP